MTSHTDDFLFRFPRQESKWVFRSGGPEDHGWRTMFLLCHLLFLEREQVKASLEMRDVETALSMLRRGRGWFFDEALRTTEESGDEQETKG